MQPPSKVLAPARHVSENHICQDFEVIIVPAIEGMPAEISTEDHDEK
jgi:hypothetical protein